jgi:hypothetical protein
MDRRVRLREELVNFRRRGRLQGIPSPFSKHPVPPGSTWGVLISSGPSATAVLVGPRNPDYEGQAGGGAQGVACVTRFIRTEQTATCPSVGLFAQGFYARLTTNADKRTNLMEWECGIPGYQGSTIS